MSTLKSSGTFTEACQHKVELVCDLHTGETPSTTTATARVSNFKCSTCGVLLFPINHQGKTAYDLDIFLTTSSPTERAAPQPPVKEKVPDKSKPQADPTKGLPGTEMLLLTQELGIVAPPGCGCKGAAATMDRLGVDGCRERITDLRLSIAAGWEKWGWKDKLRATTTSAWKAVGLGVRPTDPVRDLLEISIDRADQKRSELNKADT